MVSWLDKIKDNSVENFVSIKKTLYMVKKGNITKCGGSGNCYECERVNNNDIILVRKCIRDRYKDNDYKGYKFVYPARLNTGKWCSAITKEMVVRIKTEKDLLLEMI